jgi:peptide-methionine (S)-S-oxide reductase
MKFVHPTWFLRFAPAILAPVLFLCACQDKPAAPGGKAPAPESPAEPVAPATPASVPAASKPAPAPTETPAAAVTASEKTPMKEGNAVAQGKEIITLGGGCFWCTEAVIERLEGVTDVVSGYMGGHVENPTYEQICTKTTGHAEVIQVTFDPAKIKLEEILDVFWQAHDPTTLNRQGADTGPQYRSVIFYHTPEQKNIAMQSKAALDASKVYEYPAVTEVSAASKFWVAEDYHQNYYELNKNADYCRIVISPKLKKLKME